MAALVDITMGTLNKATTPVYPLFAKPQRLPQPELNVSAQEATTEPILQPNIPPNESGVKENDHTSNLATVEHSISGNLNPTPTSGVATGDAERLEVDLNHERRKRRKTTSPKAKESSSYERDGQQPKLQYFLPRPNVATTDTTQTEGPIAVLADDVPRAVPLDQTHEQPSPVKNPLCPEVAQVHTTSTDPSNIPSTAATCDKTKDGNTDTADISENGPNTGQTSTSHGESKPKRILRLNPKTGTIGSPPSKKKDSRAEIPLKPARISPLKIPRSKIVIFQYGSDTNLPVELGSKIEQILQGTETAANFASKKPSPSRIPMSRKVVGANTAAPPHPFFLSKPTTKAQPVQEVTSLPSNVTSFARPKSPRRPPPKTSASTFSGFGGFGGSTAKLSRFPGAVEPAWPWKGMTHVRGHDETLNLPKMPDDSDHQLKTKKSKYQAIDVSAAEDVIAAMATELLIGPVVKSIKDINIDEYPKPPSCLRIPDRHFAPGSDLQERVRRELKTRFPLSNVNEGESSSEDDIRVHGPKTQIHPALTTTFATIATSLSAFDQFRCETQSWNHKYSPKATAEVLQTGPEAQILKNWLQSLTVMSVETGVGDRSRSRASSTSRRSVVPGKRKAKSKKLEGFVVSSDEDDGDMDEITEPEDGASPGGNDGLRKKTVVRAGNTAAKGSTRSSNAVVVSGPHGCGKTAAVYAVAKELGFEVFEINSGSRRTGKDIMEKVGDMTHNHLVQSSHNQAPAQPVDEDTRRIEDALEDDLISGRQGTMNSFFKPKEPTKPKPKSKKPDITTPQPEATKSSTAPKAPPKQQKQSLILFEEVDVLYEEDKNFWATVIALIVQSKRPIIMTCTDESTVPFDSMILHAIIRFTPPPTDLATDYMLLVAANEGHIIRRNAVKSLYESRQQDLRASLTELNFWCQFAVGDFKGGLEWLYPRWPPGVDLDDHGRTVRVISDGTYEAGMGWLSRDFLKDHLSQLDIEEETLHEAWDEWGLDIGDWHSSLDITSWANKRQSQSTGPGDNATSLGIYGDFLDAMSAADICSGGAFTPDNKILLDATLPELSSKVREDYTLSHGLLEASQLVSFESTAVDISLWMKSRARSVLQADQHVKNGFEVPPELNSPSEARIIELIKNKSCSSKSSLIRRDFSLAFDPISEPEKTSIYSTSSLEASSFDRNLSLITIDIAPYVRSIVAFDAQLQQDRMRLGNLMSAGGRKTKRLRTTRSAMSALEGGARSTTRKDRYFGPGLNPHFVLKTGMQSWLDAALAEAGGSGSGTEVHEPDSGADELVGESP